MDVLIITNFTSTFAKSDNDRFLYLANKISTKNKVEILTSDFCHEKKKHRNEPEDQWPFDITFLHETGYSKNVCLKRFFSHFFWGRNVKRYLSKRNRPDLIYCAIPSLTGAFYAARYCKKNRIPFVIDIQDLWPEAFQMVLDVPILSDILFAPIKWIANQIYSNADEIIAVSETYVNRAIQVNKKCKKGYSVYLGTDLKQFDAYARQEIKTKKRENEVWIAYCGTLGSSYDLKSVIDALQSIGNPNITFLVMGDGPLKEEFENYAKEKNVSSIFTGRLPYSQMCAQLVRCDIVVNPISRGSAGSIINKHADYAASGLPVVNTQESTEYRELVESYQMGFNCRCEDANDLADRLMELLADKELRQRMGRNARSCAEKCFNRENTYLQIQYLIEHTSVN